MIRKFSGGVLISVVKTARHVTNIKRSDDKLLLASSTNHIFNKENPLLAPDILSWWHNE